MTISKGGFVFWMGDFWENHLLLPVLLPLPLFLFLFSSSSSTLPSIPEPLPCTSAALQSCRTSSLFSKQHRKRPPAASLACGTSNLHHNRSLLLLIPSRHHNSSPSHFRHHHNQSRWLPKHAPFSAPLSSTTAAALSSCCARDYNTNPINLGTQFRSLAMKYI